MNGRIARTAIVSGGSSGIGLATVRRLLSEDWHVAFFSQNEQRVAEAKAEFSSKFGAARLHCSTVDLRDTDKVRAFVRETEAAWGRVDALVANAGYSPKRPTGRTPLAEIELEEWRDVLSVNLTGALVCCQSAIPGMATRRHGRIVLVGSIAGRTMPRIASASYVASKSALVGLMRSIVSEYSASGITANVICPGRIITEMTGDPEAAANQSAKSRIPIGRLGKPEDIARAVSFLIAEDADFVNGAILDVNGGEFTAP